MELQDRLFSENTEDVLYSILMDEDEYALYSEFQKEFTSKAFKALKNKFIKKSAGELNYPVYESVGFKTVERDPRGWKNSVRKFIQGRGAYKFDNKTRKYKNAFEPGEPVDYRELFNRRISEKAELGTAASRSGKEPGGYRKRSGEFKQLQTEYDHGTGLPYGDQQKDIRKAAVEGLKNSRLKK